LRQKPWDKLELIVGSKVVVPDAEPRLKDRFSFELADVEGGRGICIWKKATADIQIYMNGSEEPKYDLEVKGSKSNNAFHLTPYQWALAELKNENFFIIYLPSLRTSTMIIIRNFYAYVMNNREIVGDQVYAVQIGVTHFVAEGEHPLWCDGTAKSSSSNEQPAGE
jgi:hypothetical protein